MKFKLYRILCISTIAAFSLTSEAAGFREIEVSDPGYPNLQVGLWYPSADNVPDEPNTEYGLAVARDSSPAGTHGGLILISHGYSGWYAGHANTAIALAEAGYLVAAPTHTGNTWSDMSSPIEKWAIDRPRHISRVIDHLLQDPELGQLIDEGKIGVYGFSAGGYTAINLLGGVPDLQQAENHCQQHEQEYVCANGMIAAMFAADLHNLPDSAWGADRRISAAAVSAPGFAFAYSPESLASITAGVQIWSGELDDSVPTQNNAAYLAARLQTNPETHWIELANHFAFLLMPCREEFKQHDPQEYEIVCGDVAGFDRREFQQRMHAEMIRFFNSQFVESE